MNKRLKAPLDPYTEYYVTNWNDGSILATYDTAKEAKKDAKARGSIYSRMWGNAPIAYVAADFINIDYFGKYDPKNYTTFRAMFYNPRFK